MRSSHPIVLLTLLGLAIAAPTTTSTTNTASSTTASKTWTPWGYKSTELAPPTDPSIQPPIGTKPTSSKPLQDRPPKPPVDEEDTTLAPPWAPKEGGIKLTVEQMQGNTAG